MKKFWDLFNVFEAAVMVIGMAIMVFFNFFNVVCRRLLPLSPFSYTEELVVIIFLWVTMFGISYGYRKGSHTMLDIFTSHFPQKLQIVTVIFFHPELRGTHGADCQGRLRHGRKPNQASSGDLWNAAAHGAIQLRDPRWLGCNGHQRFEDRV